MVYNETSKIIYGREKNVWLRNFRTDSKKYIPSPYKIKPRRFQNIFVSNLNLQGFLRRGKISTLCAVQIVDSR